MSDGAEVRRAGRLFQILAAETSEVLRWNNQLVGCGWSKTQSRWHFSDTGEAGRQVHWSTAIHCSVGEYSDFEEDALWITKPVKTGECVCCVENGNSRKSAVLERFEPTEDADSWQVAQLAHCCNSQASWGPTRRLVTRRQRSVPVARYCTPVVTCWSSTRQLAWLWFSIDRSESIKTPMPRATEEGSLEEKLIGPAGGTRCWWWLVVIHCRRQSCHCWVAVSNSAETLVDIWRVTWRCYAYCTMTTAVRSACYTSTSGWGYTVRVAEFKWHWSQRCAVLATLWTSGWVQVALLLLLLCSDCRAVVCLNWKDSSAWLSSQLAAAYSSSSRCCTLNRCTPPTEGTADIVFSCKVTRFSPSADRSQSFWRCKSSVLILVWCSWPLL